MKKRLFVILSLISLAAVMLACSPAAAPTQVSNRSLGVAPEAPMAENAGGAKSTGMDSYVSSSTDATAPGQGVERLVIRNATLSLVVQDPGVSMDAIAHMAESMGGYVVSSNLYKSTTSQGVEVPAAQVTVRVPAEKLNDALAAIKAQVKDAQTDILSENVSGQDVTKEYTDARSRLTNLEATEKQLQKFLDEATKTEDVLNIYNQLVQYREQIEVLKGQIKYYEESAALSSISVDLQATAAVQPLSIGGWRPVGVARDALQTLINTLQFLGSALIWIIIYILPVGAILVIFFLILRFFWRKIFKPKTRKAAPPANNIQPPSGPAPSN